LAGSKSGAVSLVRCACPRPVCAGRFAAYFSV
jgi:hypothetical protein